MLDRENGQSLPTAAGTERKSECLSEKTGAVVGY